METDANKIKNNEKIGKILKKLLNPNFQIQNDVCLSQILTHLADEDDEEASQNQNNIQLKIQCCQWIIQASTIWTKPTENPQPAVLAFALNLASQLSTYEQVFVKLNHRDVYERLVAVVQSYSSNEPTVTLGLVTLLCSFLEHKSGLQWVMATNHLTDIINLGLNSDILDVRKKAYYFVQKLLEKTVGFNLNFSINVVTILVKPLKDNLRSLPSMRKEQSEIDDEELYESLKSSLDFIIGVTDPLLRSFNRSVLKLFMQQQILSVTDKYIPLSRNEDFSFGLLQIQFIFRFYSLGEKLAGMKAVAYDSLTLLDSKLMLDLIDHEMDKNHVRCMIKICNYAHDLMCSLAPRMPILTKHDSTVEFENQAIYLQITPIFAFSMRMMSWEKVVRLIVNDTFRYGYIYRWLKTSAVKSIELSIKWDGVLKDKHDLIDDVIFCFHYIRKMTKLLTKERAAIIFPLLIYSFCDALTTIKAEPPAEISSSTKQYFQALMETILDLVECFNLTWTDSVETIYVMDYAYDFLNLPYWTNESMITQTGLKLLKTAISKYMSPDMVLLIDNKEDSNIAQIGSLVCSKCHDSYGEIRDSALEVVHTLSFSANTKFPAYTDILLSAELPQLVVEMAFNDVQYYVRATAFKCLQELVQIQKIWTKILEENNKFLDNLLGVFGNESEGIVRKEAASLIHKIAKYQSFPEEMLPRLFDVMTHATIGDLHGEVKHAALDFWFNKWDEHLNEQGMIDRAFPSHTFSKELKKIVALTTNEVKKRIIKVLHQLAHIGCLHVMKSAVKDEGDVEVSKKATEFTLIIRKMFKDYGIRSDNVNLSQPPSPMVQLNTTALFIPSQSQTELIPPGSKNSASYVNTVQYSSDPFENLETPQSSMSTFLNPDDPLSPILNRSSLDLINPLSLKTPQPLSAEATHNDSAFQNPSPYGNTHYQQAAQNCAPEQNQSLHGNSLYTSSPTTQTTQYTTVTINACSHTSPSSSAQSSTQLSDGNYHAYPNSSGLRNSESNPDSKHTIDIDPLGFGDDSLDSAQLESMGISNGFGPDQQEFKLEEYLNPNDALFVQEIYNSTDEVNNNTIQMKTSTYLPPSQFVKFVYELETYSTRKSVCVNKLDEFDSLLDDILTKCNIGDVISMD